MLRVGRSISIKRAFGSTVHLAGSNQVSLINHTVGAISAAATVCGPIYAIVVVVVLPWPKEFSCGTHRLSHKIIRCVHFELSTHVYTHARAGVPAEAPGSGTGNGMEPGPRARLDWIGLDWPELPVDGKW